MKEKRRIWKKTDEIFNETQKKSGIPTFAQKLSDKIANIYGSWYFIIAQCSTIIFWIVWNQIPGVVHFDAPPFILLNLILSFIAGFTGSFLQMSANRQSTKDRIISEQDYKCAIRTEQQVEELYQNLEILKQNVEELTCTIEEVLEEVEEEKKD